MTKFVNEKNVSFWEKVKQLITRLLWGYNEWFALCDMLDEARSLVHDGGEESCIIWDCEKWDGNKYLITIERLDEKAEAKS